MSNERKWICTKCKGWSWVDKAACHQCGASRPVNKKRTVGEAVGAGERAPTTLTVGDFTLVGAGKKGRKEAKKLEKRLARLEELEAKEAGGTGKGAMPAPGQDEAADVRCLQEQLACYTKWGDTHRAEMVAKELEATRRKPKALSPESCDRNVKRLQKLLDDKGASADRLQRDADAAKEATNKLAEELVAAEAEQRRVAQEYSQRIVGTKKDEIPTVQLARLLSGGQAFKLDTGELFDTEGTDIEITPEEEQEIEKRKVGLEEGLQELAAKFFENITSNIKAAKEELAEEARQRSAKKRKTEAPDQDGSSGNGGALSGPAASTAGPGEEAKESSPEIGKKSSEMDAPAGNAGSGTGGSKPMSTAQAMLEAARARAKPIGTAAQ